MENQVTIQKITADLSQLPRSWGPDIIASRVETGPLEINGDWPGVFLRGDNAGWAAMQLDQAIELLKQRPFSNTESILIASIQNLSELLKSSIVRHSTATSSVTEDVDDELTLGC